MANPTIDVANFAAYTPAETAELICRDGVKKGHLRPDKVFLSAVSAGCILSFGCAVSLTALTAPWYQENAPGLIKLVGAWVFPLGLVIIVLTGADLFTSTNMFTMVAVLNGKLSVWRMLLHWFLCFFGNLLGCLFIMAIIIGYGGTFDSDPYREEVIAFATKKQLVPAMHQIFIRAIGCNWLVCLACFLGTQARDLGSKVIGMWLPIFAFVALGFDHVVANMFFIPLGIWLGTPDLTFGLYIWKGMIPALFGNILGGSLFCGVYYWWMYLATEPHVDVDEGEYKGRAAGLGLGIFGSRDKATASDEESKIESS
ncbi:Formate/nitrite transporter [Ilyonectria robusta]|uniref:Formate/nitrite transporter n=1 Tax=Ilyonectria robusta TaxID=1079257 RepID=UPI001E8D71FC|nr:Formate/nitrite transporter [Ilyonectria robusta]KAH8664867.1 Formate/nitrite transporter [Ilyonectria robusta]